jgi:hypothetical protein
MKVVKPFEITPQLMIESNVPIDDYPEYDNAATYNTGDRVVILSTRKVYEVVSDTEISGISPLDTTTVPNWLTIGFVNRWRSLDKIVGSFTEANEPFDVMEYNTQASDPDFDPLTVPDEGIAYRIRSNDVSNTIALFNIVGSYVDVIVRTSDGIIYSKRIVLLSILSTSSWYSYFYEASYRDDRVILNDIPAGSGKDIYISVVQPSGDSLPRLGEIVIGSAVQIGSTKYNVGLNFLDFSTKERDEFGNFNIVQRGYADQLELNLSIKNDDIPFIRRFISEIRTVPSLWISSDCVAGTSVYGYLEAFNIVISGPSRSDVTVRVEGLI